MPAIAESGVQDVAEESPDLRRAGRELDSPAAELDDRDRGEEGAFPGGVGLDVALDQRRASRPAMVRASSRLLTSSRASSHRSQPGRPYRMRSGRGASSISVGIVVEGCPAPGRRGMRTGRRREERRPCAPDGGSAHLVPWGGGMIRARYDEVRAPVAQWTERGRPKACVGGSSPSGGSIGLCIPCASAMPRSIDACNCPEGAHPPSYAISEVRWTYVGTFVTGISRIGDVVSALAAIPDTRRNRKGSRRTRRARHLIRRPGSTPVTGNDRPKDGVDLGRDVGRRARE